MALIGRVSSVWADDRLEDALNIDRKTLRIAHPAYVELQEAVHDHLSKVIKTARSKLYEKGSAVRKQEQAERVVESFETFASEQLAPIDKGMARQVVAGWRRAQETGDIRSQLLRKFNVVELYEVVVDVARDLLKPAELAEFLKRLTKRIIG